MLDGGNNIFNVANIVNDVCRKRAHIKDLLFFCNCPQYNGIGN